MQARAGQKTEGFGCAVIGVLRRIAPSCLAVGGEDPAEKGQEQRSRDQNARRRGAQTARSKMLLALPKVQDSWKEE